MTQPFQLGALPTLSRSTVDRQETLRGDPDRLRARWPDALVVLVSDKGRAPVKDGATQLATRKAPSFAEAPPDDALFLGEWEGRDYWALPANPEGAEQTVSLARSWGPVRVPSFDGELWIDLRAHGELLDDTSAGLFTTGLALRNWHRRARFCARCGGRTHSVHFGWARECENCEAEEYPRTDPAIICLVHDDVAVNGEHALLARQSGWPADRFSVLAGFVEAGESLEGCVGREIREEVGVQVRAPRYLGSQPWPFPRSIMLGFTATADFDSPLSPSDGEIDQAVWVSREEVRAVLANGQAEDAATARTPIAGGAASMRLPGSSSIARVMLEAWAAADP